MAAPSFVAGQLIVKLKSSSTGGEAVTGALGGSDLHDDPALDAYLAELSAEIGTPLEATRLTSGSEVVVAVDRERLAAAVEQQLAEDPRVERVAPHERTEATPFTRPVAEWRLGFRGEEIADQISEARRGGQAATPELEAMAAEFGKSLGYDLACRVDGESELVLTLDLSALTEKLRARLAEHPDVEYVELDRLMQHF